MKVMIVDDSSFIMLVCKQALTAGGHEVVGEAFDGEEAISLAKTCDPDIILMDIALPKKNGLEATAEILKYTPHVKVIAISALDEPWVKEKTQQVGCFSFLAKPFDAKALLQAIADTVTSEGDVRYG
ncbi:MAG: response regulator [Bdellovibrionales bacterium]|nr:response regulator [Bdellovibrionales bacterium]